MELEAGGWRLETGDWGQPSSYHRHEEPDDQGEKEARSGVDK